MRPRLRRLSTQSSRRCSSTIFAMMHHLSRVQQMPSRSRGMTRCARSAKSGTLIPSPSTCSCTFTRSSTAGRAGRSRPSCQCGRKRGEWDCESTRFHDKALGHNVTHYIHAMSSSHPRQAKGRTASRVSGVPCVCAYAICDLLTTRSAI